MLSQLSFIVQILSLLITTDIAILIVIIAVRLLVTHDLLAYLTNQLLVSTISARLAFTPTKSSRDPVGLGPAELSINYDASIIHFAAISAPHSNYKDTDKSVRYAKL